MFSMILVLLILFSLKWTFVGSSKFTLMQIQTFPLAFSQLLETQEFLENFAAVWKFIVPVKYHDKWSCYFWDFKRKMLTVLDPCMMNTSSIKVAMHHEQAVLDIHKAMIGCINNFFVGWSVEFGGWSFHYPTNHGPRCKSSVLYCHLFIFYPCSCYFFLIFI